MLFKIATKTIMLLLLCIVLVACGQESQGPIRVLITTTPQPQANFIVEETTTELSVPLQMQASPTPTAEPSIWDMIPPPEAFPVLNADTMGIQVHPNINEDDWNNVIAQAQQLNVAWLKMQIPWNLLEPTQGQYSDLYATYILRVQEANVSNFKVFLSFVDAPDWARPTSARQGFNGPPANPQLLANFIADFIQATKPQDQRIAAIEIWNEPNLRDREWDGVPLDGGTYMQYFVPSYNAIKAIDPNIIVVTAGLAPVGDVDGAVSDRRFLQQMYDAGLANYPDARIGIHPYGWGNAPDERCCFEDRPWGNNRVFFFQDTIYDYIQIMQDNGHQSRLWLTEFGWGTYEGVGADGLTLDPPDTAEFFNLNTLQSQADDTIRAFEVLQQEPLNTWVEGAILWNLNFAMLPNVLDQRQEQAGYSILNAGGQPRLVWFYLVQSRRTD